jgi:endonuclease/exonuclease/phosphatase family metal-dependent hydrolase
MRFFRPILAVVLALSASSCLELSNRNPRIQLKNTGKRTEISLLTFNILATVDFKARTDGYPPWNERKRAAIDMLRSHDADIVVLDEATPGQLEEVRAELSSRYEVIANEGFTSDAAVLFRKSRFTLIEFGHWALEEPLFLQRIRRLAVWVSLRENTSARELMVVGVHLDAKALKQDEIKRLKAKLRDQQDHGAPLFLAGDFNSASDSREYQELLREEWQDSFSALQIPEHVGFTYPYRQPQQRIDHIFYWGKTIKPVLWQAIDNGKDVEISDHRAVLGRFIIDETP